MDSIFGKFRLLTQIGGGRLSQVFAVTGREKHFHPPVALKRVMPSLIGEPTFVELVVREAGLLARLSHPHLCRCLEMGVVDGCACFTLDLVQGCTLRALMRRLSSMEIQLPPSAVVAIGYQLADVLGYLHLRCPTPLVHLDLSPQNVLVGQDGGVTLIDFGIARFLDGHDPPPLGGKIAGTVGYMSPEQASGRELDQRADQFGLGILLWELLSGQRAFRGNTPATWRRMRTGQLPPAPQPLAEAPPELSATVMRLLQADPGARFDDLDQACARLAEATSDVQSGRRPLSALVQRLLKDPGFDPFDVVRRPSLGPEAPIIPDGIALPTEGYADLAIEVDHGVGTPSHRVRSAVCGSTPTVAGALPDSPFLEELAEAPAAAEIAS